MTLRVERQSARKLKTNS